LGDTRKVIDTMATDNESARAVDIRLHAAVVFALAVARGALYSVRNGEEVAMKRRCVLIADLLFILLLPAAAGAKGRFERVTIVEEGSAVETLVTDEALLGFFSFSEFSKQHLATAPRPTTRAYVVTRGGFTPDGVYHAFDRLHYYPAESPGRSGFVYYDGLVSGWSEYDHKWYAASAEGDRAMSRFIASRSPAASGSGGAHFHFRESRYRLREGLCQNACGGRENLEDEADTPGCPAGLVAAPLHVVAAPVHVDDAPLDVVAAPVHVDHALLHVDDALLHVDDAPLNVGDAPLQLVDAPGHLVDALEHLRRWAGHRRNCLGHRRR
jgi:hypothetical protein